MAGIWYRAGAVSVTSGSKKVTGFGTQWQTSTWKVEKGHAWYGPDGKPYEIDYVESDTVLYLVTAYAGPTAASQSYAIDITRTGTIPAFSRQLSAQLAYAQGQFESWQQILTGADMVTLTAPDGQQVQVPSLSAFQPTSASLKALQALTPVKDKIPVFNGSTGAELITLTAFMRTLLDDVDAASALATLGALASSSYKPRADSLNNSGGGVLVFTGDCDAMKAGDFRLVDGAQAQHAPPSGSQFCYVETKSIYSTGALLQIAWPYDGEGALLFRNYSQNAYSWSPWRKGFDSRNIIGPVSQSGGIPTGAIIERGGNANGGYVKFADGTMICNAVGYFGADSNIAYGSIFKSPGYTWTFPAPFTVGTTPACSGKLTNWSAGWVGYEATVIDSNASAGFCVMTDIAISGASSLTVTLLAVGRWY
ncbi:hypothetical protein [Aeromonas caviae]